MGEQQVTADSALTDRRILGGRFGTRHVIQVLGLIGGSLWLCSCATVSPKLPAEVTIQDAGRKSWVLVMLRVNGGEELPFVIDTGSANTFLDKSLEPRLGKRRGTTMFPHWGANREAGAYAAPEFHLGGTRLRQTGHFIFTGDWLPKARSGPPIMGVLGMDCLSHYNVQLDFEAGKMRFLNPGQPSATAFGKAFPLTFIRGRPFIRNYGLLGGEVTDLLIDSGFQGDGGMEPRTFREALEREKLASPAGIKDLGSGWMLVRDRVWDGVTYKNLVMGEGGNLIGLNFLARHLVTLDFPGKTMYLKRPEMEPGNTRALFE